MNHETIPHDIAATLVDPSAYADRRIHDAYRWLRANNPLGRAQPEGFDPFWVVTRHADILAISRQNDLFHNVDRATTLTNKAVLERVYKITGQPNLVRSLVQMDAPDHPKYRALTQGWFMPANLARFEPRIRAIARATVDRMAARGGACDFVDDVALGYPLHVIMEILGVPEVDEPRMLKLTQELFGPQDPDTARIREALSPEVFSAMMQAVVADFAAYFGGITEDRRRHPRGSGDRHRECEDQRRLSAGARCDQLLHDRRHRRPRYDLVIDGRRALGVGARPRAIRPGQGRSGTDPGPDR
jgi:cytochrome P450